MAKKTFVIKCDAEVAALLADQIAAYTMAAYPPGGSDCAQVARDALLTVANTIREEVRINGIANISVRIRSMLKATVKFHYQQLDDQAADLLLMLSVLKGEAITIDRYTSAEKSE